MMTKMLWRFSGVLGLGVLALAAVAARLQTLARPGTICISEGVYRQVRNKFDEQFVDLGRQRLKNISDPVGAYLIVPREMAIERARWPRRAILAWGIGAVALLASVSVAGMFWKRSGPVQPRLEQGRRSAGEGIASEPAKLLGEVANKPSAESGQIALGVMLFKGMGGDAQNDWRREAVRDGLNTQLSGLSRVKVYSKEFIDFLITRKGLTEIEAASQLGISKMLSGSFVEVDGTLRIETHVVDVASGVMEASYTTSGSAQDFPKLQNQLALGVISRLNLPVTADEKKTLLAQENTNTDALKMLLEAEGGVASPPPPPAPRSALPYWLALRVLIDPSPAFAEDVGAETAIKEALERYRRATESREIQALAAVYAEFPPTLQTAQEKYFENVRDLHVAIDNLDVAVVGDEAVASYTRTDDFVDARTGRPMHVAVRLTKTLRKENGVWKLAGAK